MPTRKTMRAPVEDAAGHSSAMENTLDRRVFSILHARYAGIIALVMAGLAVLASRLKHQALHA